MIEGNEQKTLFSPYKPSIPKLGTVSLDGIEKKP